MQRVVLDTNILVSALLKPASKPAEIIRAMAMQKILVFYNQAIFMEYEAVLPRAKFGFAATDVSYLLRLFQLQGVLLKPDSGARPLPDESDRIFYDTAKVAGAYLVTGNIKHYPRAAFIVTPAAFRQMVAG
ncbi:MAG: putative toxin-antitoxin system toxin component, PIN family [Candidatus Margulisbacteria bacterium]|jgi:putative PIN family toxin of toxin-antitoxin system|nr:putative toxin-antitoxin system toxin component, PIN family [Candidatus Margulisiibacteriota bacterium]